MNFSTAFSVAMLLAFSSRARILRECLTIHFPPVLLLLLLLLFLFVFLMEISSRTLIPLFRLGSVYSGSVS